MKNPTVLEILNKSSDFFKAKGIEHFRLDAQLLLGHVLGLERMELYLNFDRPMSPREVDLCRDAIARRSKREPLQHIIGEVAFRNLNLKTDIRALIPRPETELIIDFLVELYPNVSKEDSSNKTLRGLEVGVGTGAICLSVLKEFPHIHMTGVDISPEALELTQENATKNELAFPGERGTLVQSDLLQNISGEEPWDFIISNPPYISQGNYEQLEPEVKDWDPKLALVGGTVGTECIERLLQEALPKVQLGGWLILEIGHDQAKTVVDKASTLGWKNHRIKKDYGDVERFVAVQR
jgi:release factor glutamine methyltransferase